MKQIAVMGYGVVGSGVVEVFYKNHASIVKKAGEELELKYILELRDCTGDPYEGKVIRDFSIIAQDPQVSVVVEVMGGLHPAYEFVKTCLEQGKSVVTSNKELVAQKGAELLKTAREHHVNFFFEASVGGGIPIIRPLHSCLAANEIDEIAGILNGTTNFILTKMFHERADFALTLALAQKLGYAEKDPTADIEGLDACRKICILASLAFGRHIYPSQVQTQGISGITREDVALAESAGCVIKLIGRVKRYGEDKVLIAVSPALISHESQLASINDVFNGILVRGNATGDVVFYGKGAGKLPTASAVVADVIDAVKATDTVGSLYWTEEEGDYVEDLSQDETAFFLRIEDGGSHQVLDLFPGSTLLPAELTPAGQTAFLTPVLRRGDLEETLAKAGYPVLSQICLLDY